MSKSKKSRPPKTKSDDNMLGVVTEVRSGKSRKLLDAEDADVVIDEETPILEDDKDKDKEYSQNPAAVRRKQQRASRKMLGGIIQKDGTIRKAAVDEAKEQRRQERKMLQVRGPLNAVGRVKGGRVPSAIRQAMREDYDKRRQLLNDIIDGEVVEECSIQLSEVMKYAMCPRCKNRLSLHVGYKGKEREILLKAKKSARTPERLQALDHLAKYGLGTTREVSIEEVRERVLQTVQIIQTHVDGDTAKRILKAMKPIWSTT